MATVKLDPAKGIQIPNLTTTERNAISSPETGAIIWNTTTSEINQYNGSAWEITYTDTNTQIAGITSSADATAITINSSENVGIGVVPEVTHPTHDALQLGGNGNWSSYGTQGASGEMDFQHNAYFAPSGADKYISTDEATKYRQGSGTHRFYTAPSGSADAGITWTQRARIDSDGLKFNNDSAAANALSDYEEGYHITVWTAASSGTITPNRSIVAYTKIGNMVHITGEVDITAVSSPSGGTKFTLPFVIATASTQRNTNFGGAGFAAYHINFLENNPPIILGHAGDSHVQLTYQRNDSSFYAYNAAAGDTFFFSFSYKTN